MQDPYWKVERREEQVRSRAEARERRAEEEKRRRAKEQKRRKAEEEKGRRAKEQKKRRAEEEKRRRAEEKERRRAEEEERRRAEEEEEPAKIRKEFLEREGVSPIMFEALKKINQSTLEGIGEEMKKGKIPFHLEESEQWAAFGSQLQSMNEAFQKNKTEEIIQLEDTIRKQEAAIRKQEAELVANKQKLETLSRAIPAMKQLEEDIPTMITKIPLLSETEVQLSKEIKECIIANPEDLVASKEDGPALSLVFNSAGLSEESIAAFTDFDGFEFLNSNLPKLATFEQQKEALFLRHMFGKKQVPYSDHIEDCAVCCCKNGEELRYLMEEHRIQDEVADLLFASPIPLNGRYFLFLDFEDIINHFNLSITKQQFSKFRKTFKPYFSKIHKEADSN